MPKEIATKTLKSQVLKDEAMKRLISITDTDDIGDIFEAADANAAELHHDPVLAGRIRGDVFKLTDHLAGSRGLFIEARGAVKGFERGCVTLVTYELMWEHWGLIAAMNLLGLYLMGVTWQSLFASVILHILVAAKAATEYYRLSKKIGEVFTSSPPAKQ